MVKRNSMNEVNWLSCNGRNPVTFSGTSFVKTIIYHHYFILEFLYVRRIANFMDGIFCHVFKRNQFPLNMVLSNSSGKYSGKAQNAFSLHKKFLYWHMSAWHLPRREEKVISDIIVFHLLQRAHFLLRTKITTLNSLMVRRDVLTRKLKVRKIYLEFARKVTPDE